MSSPMENERPPTPQEDRADTAHTPQRNNFSASNGYDSQTASMKPDGPQQGENSCNADSTFQYDLMPTPFNPPRIDRCRIDNFLMVFIMLLMFVFGVAALATSIVRYNSSAITISVDCLFVWGATTTGTHQRNSNHDIFCDAFTSRSDGFAALFIICVLCSVLGFVLALVPIICGRVICCRYFVQALILLCWLFTMIAMALAAELRNSKLCNNTSLGSIGFTFGPAFGLAVTLFVLFTLTIVVLVVWMIKFPAKLRY